MVISCEGSVKGHSKGGGNCAPPGRLRGVGLGYDGGRTHGVGVGVAGKLGCQPPVGKAAVGVGLVLPLVTSSKT